MTSRKESIVDMTPEQRALRDTARAVLAGEPSWAALAGLDWFDPALGPVELAVVAEEVGHTLHSGPWFGTAVLAVPATGRTASRPTTLAVAARCVAARTDGGWRLTGTARRVPDAHHAESVLVGATTSSGIALFELLTPPAVEVFSPDPTRPLFDLHLDGAAAELVVADAGPALRHLRLLATAVLAAEALGVARWAITTAAAHARIRTQFGRPIGAFQAVSHRIADMYADQELARSLVYHAARCLAAGRADGVPAAAVAAHHAALSACEGTIQILGGIGFTWEHPAHRYYRRAQWIAGFDGTATSRRAEIAAGILSGTTSPAVTSDRS
jgi:alkylation response protein AidB-like acyl-CoA dehydrogenase